MVCWAFDTVPSRLPEVFWAYSFDDLRSKMRMVVGLEHVRGLVQFTNLAEVAAMAFGGKGGKGGKSGGSGGGGARPIQNVNEAKMSFAAVMREARGG